MREKLSTLVMWHLLVLQVLLQCSPFLARMACKWGRKPPDDCLAVQSPGLPHVEFEDLIGQEMTVKVLEAIEEKDRLILSNKKTAFETNKKLSYTVGLAPPLAPHDQLREHSARQ